MLNDNQKDYLVKIVKAVMVDNSMSIDEAKELALVQLSIKFLDFSKEGEAFAVDFDNNPYVVRYARNEIDEFLKKRPFGR